MHKRTILTGLIMLSTPFLMAHGEPGGTSFQAPDIASGNGNITFGEHGEGIGFFIFDVERNVITTGSLLFAAEHRHGYPDIVVRMDNIERAVFSRRLVKLTGTGTLHETPVSISVTAFDGDGTPNPDRFSIKCINSNRDVVFDAKGDLAIGNIVVGAVD